jgi:ferredoxin
MADKELKNPKNASGKYYTDNTCIDCDMCRNIAPRTFTRDDESGYSYAFKQPATVEEIAQAEEALNSCPAGTIGNDGDVIASCDSHHS